MRLWMGEPKMLLPGNSSQLEDHRKQQQDYLIERRDTEFAASQDKHAVSMEGFGYRETQRI